ncbi:MAG: Ig-like domain-containing protein, partial [Verrucomicrobiales bacterium]
SKVTLSVADAQGARSEQTVSWNLRSINDPPFFEGPEGVTVKPGQPILPIPITKITDGSDFEQQALTFYLEVEGDPLIASHQMVFQQGESSGYLNITLHPAVHGKAELALSVDDGSQMHSTYIQRFPLIVEPPDNLKPTVTWLNPRSGSSMVLRDNIELKVFAEDLDGTIASLLFHANGVPIGEADPIGGSLEWIPSTPGSYQLTATVIDDLGASTLSEPIEIRVDPMVNQSPLVEWLEPSGETSLWLGQTLRMQIQAQDPDGVITRTRFLVNGAFLGEGIE